MVSGGYSKAVGWDEAKMGTFPPVYLDETMSDEEFEQTGFIDADLYQDLAGTYVAVPREKHPRSEMVHYILISKMIKLKRNY